MSKIGKIPQGYIALHRKIQNNFVWQELREFSKAEAWIDILMEAQHSEKPRKILLGNVTLQCHYGQSLKSIHTWAERWNWTKSKVFRFFTLLKNEGMIKTKSEGVTERLIVCNYSRYDPKRNASETQIETQIETAKDSGEKGLQDSAKRNSKRKSKTDKNESLSNNDNTTKSPTSGEFTTFWNSHENLPKIIKFTDERKRALVVRNKESEFTNNWQLIIDKLSSSPFHTGQGGRNWRANVDWLLKNDTNYVKILELAEPEYSTHPLSEEEAEQLLAEAKADDS